MESERLKGGSVTLTIAGVTAETGMCATLVRNAIREGRLKARYIGRKPLILRSDLQEFVASLPAEAPHRRKAKKLNAA